MTHEGILAEHAATYPLALVKQQRLRLAHPLSDVEIRVAYGLGYDVVVSIEHCTERQGPDGDKCGNRAVVVDVDGEHARCNDCLVWLAQAGRPTRPIHLLN